MAKDPKKIAARLYPDMNKMLEKEAAYYEALGRFIGAFAEMETAMALTFWRFARSPTEIARAVFSGVRAKEAGDQCHRIMEAIGVPAPDIAAFKVLTDQMGALNKARNDIVHYGAAAIGSESAYVTNALKAHVEKKVNEFPVSPEILAKMQHDAVKITCHLEYEYLGRDWPKSPLGQMTLQRVLQSPWLYKHQPRQPKRPEGKDKKPPA